MGPVFAGPCLHPCMKDWGTGLSSRTGYKVMRCSPHAPVAKGVRGYACLLTSTAPYKDGWSVSDTRQLQFAKNDGFREGLNPSYGLRPWRRPVENPLSPSEPLQQA